MEDEKLLSEMLHKERFQNFKIQKGNKQFSGISQKETKPEIDIETHNGNEEKLEIIKSESKKEQMELNQAMCIAVTRGKPKILEMILEAGADIHAFDDCYPLLHTIVDMNNIELFKVAKKYSKSLNIESKHGNLLSAAVRVGSLELLKEIYKDTFQDTSTEEYDNNKSFPIHDAVTNIQSVVKKINKHIFLNESEEKTGTSEKIITPTVETEENDIKYDLQILKYLIEIGCNVNKQGPCERTPLHLAAMAGNMEVVNYLVKKGATKHVFDKNEQTPFMIAALFRHHKLLDALLDVNHIDNLLDTGESLMHFAISYRLVDALKYLLDKGADANVLNSRNQTPLFTAIDEKNAEGITCIKMLLGHTTCDVWKNIDNENALDRLLSAYYYHREDYRQQRDEILDLFLQRGLDINKVYEDGNTMLTREIENNYWMTKWVLKNGGNPDYVKPNGEYALYMTCDRHRHQETETLLKYNADVTLTIKQFENMTPLMRALETKDYHLIKLCLEAGFSFYKVHDWLKENKNIRDELWSQSQLRPFVHYIENKPYAPMSLRGLARIKVLKNMGHENHEEKVKTLGLPILMENFLIWEKYLDMRVQFFDNYKMPDTD